MYCPKCGAANPDEASSCVSCNASLAAVGDGVGPGVVRTSKAAIASFILGILSIFTCFLTALPAIICGIVGLVRVGQGKGRVKGVGLAVAGIVVPVVLFPIMMMLLAIVLPALNVAKDTAQRVICETNLKGLSLAMMVYQRDYDAMPTPQQWCDLLVQEADVGPMSFRCPAGPEARGHYALNVNAVGSLGELPADMVLLFEASPGWNMVGGPELLTTEYHKGRGCNVAFADGHIEFVPANELGRLRWTADENDSPQRFGEVPGPHRIDEPEGKPSL